MTSLNITVAELLTAYGIRQKRGDGYSNDNSSKAKGYVREVPPKEKDLDDALAF